MNEKWKKRDLKLKEEKKVVGEPDTTIEEWTRHIVDLKENEEIAWPTYSGLHRHPYGGPHAFHFTFVSADDCIRIKAARTTEQDIVLDDDSQWTSDWYEADGYSYRVSIRIIESLYHVSELPPNVRTMQQTDHDAWEYAVRNGLI